MGQYPPTAGSIKGRRHGDSSTYVRQPAMGHSRLPLRPSAIRVSKTRPSAGRAVGPAGISGPT